MWRHGYTDGVSEFFGRDAAFLHDFKNARDFSHFYHLYHIAIVTSRAFKNCMSIQTFANTNFCIDKFVNTVYN